jgi:hypothetical protein
MRPVRYYLTKNIISSDTGITVSARNAMIDFSALLSRLVLIEADVLGQSMNG